MKLITIMTKLKISTMNLCFSAFTIFGALLLICHLITFGKNSFESTETKLKKKVDNRFTELICLSN